MTTKNTIQAFMPLSFVVAIMFFLFPNVTWAQGKTGTTLTLDGTNYTVLYSQGAASSTQAYFSYLRHNALPIQIINANYYGLADNGTGFFKAMVNNMGITNGDITLYNNAGNFSELFIAIIAPQGYNIARYQMDVNSSVVRAAAAGNAAGAVIEEYTYTQNNSDGERVLTDNVFTLDGSSSQLIDVTKAGVNKLYFRVGFMDTKGYQISFNSLKITFTIDESFGISIPNESGGTDVHTGLVDLGEFSSNYKGVWTFTDTNVTDVQDFGFFGMDDEGQDISVSSIKVDGEDYVWTVKNGTFYLEAPKTYRVTGARLKFLSREMAVETETQYIPVASVTSGDKYIIGNGTAFLKITGTSSYSVTTTTNKEEATVWTVTDNGSGAYYIYSDAYGRYLYADGSLSLSTSKAAGNYGSTAAWTYDTSTGYLYMSYKGRYSTTTYYLRYSSSSLGVTSSTSGSNGNSRIKNPFTQVIAAEDQTMPASTYTATVYGTDANTPVDVYEISPENDEVSIPLNNLNNDAVKFKIDGLTGNEVGIFRVSIDVLMLDPFVQTIETAHVEDGNVISAVSSSSMNLKFNNGETIVVPIPGTSGGDADQLYQLVFRNAFNENRSVNVSETPSGNGLSNCYLIDSPHELSGTGSYIEADKAGTTVLDFTNIKEVKAGKESRLKDNEFNKIEAGYEEIWLKNGETKTVYIYAADVPTYLVIPESRRKVEHIAYCYYQAKVMPYIVEEVPDLEVADVNDIIIYNSTLKGTNNKNKSITKDSDLDSQHYFFGIKVKAKKQDTSSTDDVKGILTSEQIINAVKDLLIINFKDHLYADDDPFRTILYLDMSELTAVSDADGLWDDFRSKTADNCLYFMPSSFSQQAQNVIAGGADGNGEAVGDIVIYDQQPFFTPYTFKTGTHMVTYERTGTNDKNPTQNTTMIVPFDIPLSADGHLKTYSNQVDENVQFYHMTGIGEENSDANVDTKVYQFTAEPVTTGIASANTPYHIVSQKPTNNASYKIQLTGATFMPSSKAGVMTVENGTLTGYGSYNGVTIDKTEDILYFSKDYFWRSSTLTTSNTVKILPYRAYYKSSEPLPAKQFAVLFKDVEDDNQGIATQIAGNRGFDFQITPQHGSILVSTNSDTPLRVYDLTGRMILNEYITAGTCRQFLLPSGIYIVNSKKVLVK